MSPTIATGSEVDVADLGSGRRTHLAIVDPDAACPAQGRYSADAPLPRALLGHVAGETVEVHTPVGPRAVRIEVVYRAY